jgi:sugar lactone lactonase YvrE
MSIRLFQSFRLWSNLRNTLAATPKPTMSAAGARPAPIRLGARASLRCAGALLFAIGTLCPMAAAQTARFSGARSKIVDGGQLPGVNRDANVADSGRSLVHREQSGTSADFGAVKIGATSTPRTLTFTFDAAVTLGSTAVLTQGSPNLDFADAGTGTCATGNSYNSGDTCTVDATFTPKFAGSRYGAAVLNDNSGNVIATGYVQGIGSGPQVTFAPGAESIFGTDILGPNGMAVDGAGNVYVADYGNNRVVKETLSSGSYTETTIINGLNLPSGLALDAAGNLYVANYGGTEAYKETLSGGSYTQTTLATGLNIPNGVTVDGAGNVYIADSGNGRLLKETLSAGSYAQTDIYDCGTGERCPSALALDGKGNLFITSYESNQVLELTPSASGYTQSSIGSGLNWPSDIAVDGGGDLYIADTSE